jgi:predicted ATPase
MHRIEGELLLKAGASRGGSPPEERFLQAIDTARRQGARSWELRAAMSLGRLWQRQGRRDAARELLAQVRGWFTEGLDTGDLRDARALLGELER